MKLVIVSAELKKIISSKIIFSVLLAFLFLVLALSPLSHYSSANTCSSGYFQAPTYQYGPIAAQYMVCVPSGEFISNTGSISISMIVVATTPIGASTDFFMSVVIEYAGVPSFVEYVCPGTGDCSHTFTFPKDWGGTYPNPLSTGPYEVTAGVNGLGESGTGYGSFFVSDDFNAPQFPIGTFLAIIVPL